ncbi:phosphoglycerate mutase (plasmid) [Peptoclostridium acidaminophilum DSM 3953]|uniref:Phosphoglycerate mutase n=1 Tax=Peptoclostridium acidaminophilum DSM 3953 TaxID=1286171 RepID=W8TN39_PEPAC|nr:histidine phosphatase family protein [Peptoclostridium acidaminophilum]AHM57602.1 phosphoglycerate mutase [Peptoclostridium acidaminophilum DSM 3953]
MRLILVRHVQTVANAENRIYGRLDSDFTGEGLAQLEWLRRELAHERVDAVFSSPMSRALSVAKEMSKTLQLGTETIQVRDELSEMDFGIFEGLTYEEAMQRHPVEWESYCESCMEYKIPGGESFAEFERRIGEFIESLEDDDSTVLIVTHGGVVQSIMTRLLGFASEQRWHFRVRPASIVEIETAQGYGILNRLIWPREE